VTLVAERSTSALPAVPDHPVYRAFEGLVKRWVRSAERSGRGRRAPGHVDRDLRVRVAAVREIADGVRTFTFVRRDGGQLPSWDPGAHVDVVLSSGAMRQYSLNSDPDDLSHYRVGVRLIEDGGGGSREMHALRVGDELILKGPRNAFPFIDSPGGYLFVAGGIGITPILPMLRDVARRELPWTLIYTGRTRASMPFLDELATIVAGHEDRVHLWPDDERGAPDPRRILELAPAGAALYCCGPPPMIESIRSALLVEHGPAGTIDTLHYERFSSLPVRGGEPFRVRLARTGEVVEVDAHTSALAAILREARPRAAYSCRQGFCGTCRVGVIAGEVDHRDRVLTPAERESHMMLCVSRAAGEVVIDL